MISSRRKKYGLIILSLVILLVLSYYFRTEFVSFVNLFSDPEEIRSIVKSYEPFGLLVLYGLQIAQVILAPVPGQVVGIVFGTIYGSILGAILGTIGNIIATAIIIFLTKRYGRPLVERLTSDDSMNKYQRMIKNADVYPFAILVVLPVIPDDVVCYAAGLSSVGKYRLIVAISIARTPGMITLAIFGNNLVDYNPMILAIVGVPVAILIVFVIWKREEIFDYLDPEEE